MLTPARPREPEFLDRLRELGPDCVPGRRLRRAGAAGRAGHPRHGWINLHFSLLPAWRGAAPVQHAVLHGDEITGASVFQLEEGLDTGPVFGTLTEPIRPTDTSGDLLDRLAVSGAELLVECSTAIAAGTLEPVPQPAEGVSLAPKITVEDARVGWAEPGVRRRPPDPGLHPGPRRLDDVPRRAAQARPGPPSCRAARALPPGELLVGEAAGARRHGHRPGRARRGPGGRQEGRWPPTRLGAAARGSTGGERLE